MPSSVYKPVGETRCQTTFVQRGLIPWTGLFLLQIFLPATVHGWVSIATDPSPLPRDGRGRTDRGLSLGLGALRPLFFFPTAPNFIRMAA
jgi:hypothetical protein